VYPLSTPHIPPISGISVSSDGLLGAAVDEGGMIHLWPLDVDPTRNFKVLTHVVHPRSRALRCLFSPYLNQVDNTRNRNIEMSTPLSDSIPENEDSIELEDGYLQVTRAPHNSYNIITCGSDSSARLWRFDTIESFRNCILDMEEASFKPVADFKGHERWVWDAAFTADGEYLMTASSDGTAKLWDTSETHSDALCTFEGHLKGLTSIFLNDSLL